MIEVNLLPGKKRKAAAGQKFTLPDFKTIVAQIRDPWLIAAIVGWGIAIVGAGGFFIMDRTRLGRLDRQLETVRSDKRRFDVVIAQKRNSEKIRDSLVAQIDVIRGIDADRYVWPHVLDQVTKALPPYTWLTNVQTVAAAPGQPGAPPGSGAPGDSAGASLLRLSVSGRTVDFQAYTNFLRQLAASPWFTDVTPSQSATVIESDRPVTEFNVTLRYRVADSVYIRTVPLVQSVR
jgi:Tfp pilus assembly protein PilN